MESNLDKIALDLYDKIQTKFPDVEMGDEHGDVLSKKEDIPNGRPLFVRELSKNNPAPDSYQIKRNIEIE